MNESGINGPVLVVGAAGMVGSAICRALDKAGVPFVGATRSDADFRERDQVDRLLQGENYGAVIIAAARVGGIHANDSYPADFIYDNLMIQTNLIDAAYKAGIERLLFLGSSCIYPKHSPQPMAEDCLLTGVLEPTNEPYAIAKIAGIKMCESYNRQYGTDYRALMPTNLYGPGDQYYSNNSHVIPALISRFHEAKTRGDDHVEVWGTGTPKREFLHTEDLADACLHFMSISKKTFRSEIPSRCSHINIGSGKDISIADLAKLVSDVVGFDGETRFDRSKPDGTPRRLLDVDRATQLGWQSNIELAAGLNRTYEAFLDQYEL